MAKMGNPNWVKGKSGNPNGRPKAGISEIEQLREAIKVVSTKKRKGLFQHFVEQAYEDSGVLAALMRKVLPDMKAIDLGGQFTIVLNHDPVVKGVKCSKKQ